MIIQIMCKVHFFGSESVEKAEATVGRGLRVYELIEVQKHLQNRGDEGNYYLLSH